MATKNFVLSRNADAKYLTAANKKELLESLDAVSVTVANPSGQGKNTSCFMNGILENKEFIINYNQGNEIVYDGLEKSINSLPSKKIDEYLTEQILKFIRNIQ